MKQVLKRYLGVIRWKNSAGLKDLFTPGYIPITCLTTGNLLNFLFIHLVKYLYFVVISLHTFVSQSSPAYVGKVSGAGSIYPWLLCTYTASNGPTVKIQ